MTIGPIAKQSDMFPYMEFINPTFHNVQEDAIAYYYPPPDSWLNWEDCGIEFTCTGPYNIVVRY